MVFLGQGPQEFVKVIEVPIRSAMVGLLCPDALPIRPKVESQCGQGPRIARFRHGCARPRGAGALRHAARIFSSQYLCSPSTSPLVSKGMAACNCSSDQSHQRISSSSPICRSSKRLRITFAGLPPTMA